MPYEYTSKLKWYIIRGNVKQCVKRIHIPDQVGFIIGVQQYCPALIY